jgi:hypothetical protein
MMVVVVVVMMMMMMRRRRRRRRRRIRSVLKDAFYDPVIASFLTITFEV